MVTDWLFAGLFALAHALLVTVVYRYVPEPYMDEIFHVRQTRKYCAGNWSWDPMITTPPALYILGIPLCGFERYTNSVLHRSYIHRLLLLPKAIPQRCCTFVSSCRYSISVLYYTDLLSLCAVVWGFTLDSPVLSSLTFTVGVLTRQTNIVWAGLSGAVRLLRDFDTSRPISTVVSSLLRLFSFIVLAFAFTVFVYINGGIVLGDASAHHPRLHLAQFLYLGLFTGIHAWPHTIPRLRSFISRLIHPFSALLAIPIALSAQYFAFDHPYLLADNRHVTFYLWRWWLADPVRRVLLTPLFLGSFIFIRDLSNHISPFTRILFVLCSFAVVVPAHLLEPRYFIIPY
ncbi:DIE2/ALG10 family protein, partial [Ostertagia ostertagi]